MVALVSINDLPLLNGPTGIMPGRHLLEGAKFGLHNLTLVLGENAPGTGAPPHHHEYEEIFVIHSGRGRYTVGATTVEAGPGDVIVIPSGVTHGFVNHTEEPLRHTAIHGAGNFVYQMPD